MRIPPEYRRRKRRKPYQKKNVVAKEESIKSGIDKKSIIEERITKTDSSTVCNLSPKSLGTIVATEDTDTINETPDETNDERVLKLDLTHFKLLDIPMVSPVEPIDVHITDNLLRKTEDCLRFFFGKCLKLLTKIKRPVARSIIINVNFRTPRED